MAGAGITTTGDLVRLTFEIEGYERVSVGLSRAASTIRDFTPFWRTVVAPWFFRQIVQNFQTEGRPVGGWQPLSPRYAAWKAKHYPGKTILRRSDRLIRSLTMTGGSLGPDGLFQASPQTALFGTHVPYARHHQWGSKRKPGRPPQRRILYLPTDSSRALAKMLQRWAVETVRSHVQSTTTPMPVFAGPGGGLL